MAAVLDPQVDVLLRAAFTEPGSVLLRSASHDLAVEAPAVDPVLWQQLTASFGAAEPVWAAPGVDGAEVPAGPDPLVVAAQQAVARLLERAPSGRPADVAALYALGEQLQGLRLTELAEMHATGAHLATGAPTAATWLRDERTVSDLSARADVRLAEALRTELPSVGAALRQGRTTVEHARAAVAGTRGLDPRVVQDSDPAISRLVQSTDPPTVRAHLRERAEAVSPDLGRDSARRAHERRAFTVDAVGSSGGVLGGSLGVEDTQVLLLGLDTAVQADRTRGDQRSLRQRRADVLLTWARAALAEHGAGTVREDLRSTRAQLLLSCTLDQLTQASHAVRAPGGPPGPRQPAGGSLGPGLLVGLDALRRLACDASVSLLVTPDPAHPATWSDAGGGPLGIRTDLTRQPPLYVGRAARIVDAVQWRALVTRDRHCVVKGCRRPPLQCEAHHVRHWLDGGSSDPDNLVLLCFAHHHEHHDQHRDLQHRDGRWITDTGWGSGAPP